MGEYLLKKDYYTTWTPGTSAISADTRADVCIYNRIDDGEKISNFDEDGKIASGKKFYLDGISVAVNGMTVTQLAALIAGEIYITVRIDGETIWESLLETIKGSGGVLGVVNTDSDSTAGDTDHGYFLPGKSDVRVPDNTRKLVPIVIQGGKKIEIEYKVGTTISASSFDATDRVRFILHGYEATLV